MCDQAQLNRIEIMLAKVLERLPEALDPTFNEEEEQFILEMERISKSGGDVVAFLKERERESLIKEKQAGRR